MTLPMIIALAVTVLMIILIMVDKLPFGAPPLLALLLLVVFGVTDIKTAFGGFANPTIVMLASFMAIIAALQKTSFIVKFKQTMFNMANKGGFKAYVLLILIVMLGCSLFGTGSTAYYVLVIGLLSTLPYSKQLPPSKVLMPAGFAANHPLLPFNTALQYRDRRSGKRRRCGKRQSGQVLSGQPVPVHRLPSVVHPGLQDHARPPHCRGQGRGSPRR